MHEDELNDLAIIKSDISHEDFVTLRGGKGARIGEEIITMGYPLGSFRGNC
jgi:S1-C subfamily serine protease